MEVQDRNLRSEDSRWDDAGVETLHSSNITTCMSACAELYINICANEVKNSEGVDEGRTGVKPPSV